MKFGEKISFSLLVVAAVATATWSEGGYGDHVITWITIFAGIALLPLIHALVRRHLSAKKSEPALPSIKPWLPAAILMVIVAASLANVTHEKIMVGQRVAPHGGETRILVSDGFQAKKSAPTFLPGTVIRALTAQQLQLHLAILVIAFILWMLLTRQIALWILTLLVINGLVLALVGIHFHFNDNGLLLGKYDPVNPRYFSAFRYHLHWSAFSLLSFTAGIGLAVFPGLKKGWRIAALTLVGTSWCVFLYAATLAQSRSLVLLLVGAFGIAVLQLMLMLLSRHKAGRPVMRLLLPLACVLVLAAAGAVFTGKKIVEGRALDSASEWQAWKEGKTPIRLLFARDTLKMVAARPLWGCGLGCYRYAFTAFAGPEFREDRYQSQTAYYGRLITTHFAHNDWLQYWSELGTPAMFCLIAFPWMLLQESKRSGRRNATSYWCLGGCALILVLALWDFPLSNPAILLLTAVVFVIGVKLRITLANKGSQSTKKRTSSGASSHAGSDEKDECTPHSRMDTSRDGRSQTPAPDR